MSDATLSTCGCCQGLSPLSPEQNDPGLPALAYRLGTYGTFYQRMLSQIQSNGPLAALTTRSPDDPAIALMDAWAVVADVLTFYQERIANEGFLRTAAERRSVLELASAIGYELNPGVAASAFLVFTVEDVIGGAVAPVLPQSPKLPNAPTLGAPTFNLGIVTVPEGSKLQSIPPQGKLPQTFETSADLLARTQWNQVLPRLTRPPDFAITSGGNLYLLGVRAGFPSSAGGTTLSPGSVYRLNPDTPPLPAQPVAALPVQQIFLAGVNTGLNPGDRLLLAGKNSGGSRLALVFVVRHVTVLPAQSQTRVDFADNPAPISFAATQFRSVTVPSQPVAFNQVNVNSFVLQASIDESDIQALIQTSGWNPQDLANLVNNLPAPSVSSQGVFSFAAKAGFFGNNAPLWDTLPNPTQKYTKADPFPVDWDTANGGAGQTVWTNSQGTSYTGASVYLERTFPQILDNGWVVLESPDVGRTPYQITKVIEKSLADYGLSGRATGLTLQSAGSPAFPVRTTTAYVQSVQQGWGEIPVTDDIQAGSTTLMLNGLVLGLVPGQAVALNGMRSDASGVTANEILVLADIVHDGGYTTLEFVTGLQYSYQRPTLTVNANVASSTNGDTIAVPEVLGSGDASEINQSFTLKRIPLTYVGALTAAGSESTLQVRVNDLLWQEVPSLYELGPNDQCYITRLADDGSVTVTFGDGVTGARLPTGQNNVVATYRAGIGLNGNVGAGTISILQSRPPGLRSVINPLPASGGADPENLDHARGNAPLTVLTLDRIVSLEDYQEFAAAFPGIGKAQAVPLWTGETGLVHLTVAGVEGAPVGPTSQLFLYLLGAIDASRDPVQQVRVSSYQQVLFNLTATAIIEKPRYVAADVLAAVKAALISAFSFDQRDFAQPVSAAEVITTIQAVPGVIATDLTQLYRNDDPSGPFQSEPDPVLSAAFAHWQGSDIAPAELLLLNPGGFSVTEKIS